MAQLLVIILPVFPNFRISGVLVRYIDLVISYIQKTAYYNYKRL